MSILETADSVRVIANKGLDPKSKSSLGQFFTSAPIALFMASMFDHVNGKVKLLDAGCGPGSLTAAFIDEAVKRGERPSISIDAYEIDSSLCEHLGQTLSACALHAREQNIIFESNIWNEDYIISASSSMELHGRSVYSHVIMNPPYKKISSSSSHRLALSRVGIETVNLYSGFVALALMQLAPGGELVAIIPRSFCNGPYYQAFREHIIRQAAIKHIHIFDSRDTAFSEDDVLQENIILHLVKGAEQGDVQITSSPIADFHVHEESGTVTASDMTTRVVPFSNIIRPDDRHSFFHIAANNRDLAVVNKLSVFSASLADLKLAVSTGPVVGFRTRDNLFQSMGEGRVPLLYPTHLSLEVEWPKDGKKANAIAVNQETAPSLWRQGGGFVIVRRFSSKEEKRRIFATLYESSLPGEFIGFDNGLNVFHGSKKGLDKFVARGLFVYLNCSLIDRYYRLFGGHTQVNATDLRNIPYPNMDSLCRLGKGLNKSQLTQHHFDELVEEEIFVMAGKQPDPLAAQRKIDQAITILKSLGLPRAQLNERSALTLLALVNLTPDGSWSELKRPLMGVTPIMDWCRDVYGKEYAPNTRETFRRQTLHQFVDAGICLYNPDKPDRAVNSPAACYQIALELFHVLAAFESAEWQTSLESWLGSVSTLVAQYAMGREMELIPLLLNNEAEIKLSPGAHSLLIHDIVTEFGPRFAPGAEVIYLGDTGAKEDFFKKERLAELGVEVDRKGKLPDVVLYWPERNWLLLIESVTSHGPVDGKRHGELSKLFHKSTAGLVYVTAFPDRKTMVKYLPVISWETEVWVADAPTHMIHFNGDRFLGPHD